MRLECVPESDPLCAQISPLMAAAAQRLAVDVLLDRLTFALDDIDADHRVWLSLRPARTAAGIWRVVVYLHPDHLLKDRPPPGGLLPPRQIWDAGSEGGPEAVARTRDFQRPKAERFIHHQLLFIRDLLDGTVDPVTLPPELAEAFQEVWSVVVDGRLRQDGLPGYSQAERRRSFLRLFARAGVLLPVHWRIFHRLWDGEVPDQESALRLTQRLPRLRQDQAGAWS